MNYIPIQNRFELDRKEILEKGYADRFYVQIYYIEKNKIALVVRRLDSNTGWGLNLKIFLYPDYSKIRCSNDSGESDSSENDKKDIECVEEIIIGSSSTNSFFRIICTKTDCFPFTSIYPNFDIPSYLPPRPFDLIENNFRIAKSNVFIDFHIVVYYINQNECQIILRRLDSEKGWEEPVCVEIDDIDFPGDVKERILVPASSENDKVFVFNTIITLQKKNRVVSNGGNQHIPKIIFQTGNSKNFKNTSHLNSVLSFIELNPEYTYIYFDDFECRKFLRKFFNKDVNEAYDLLVPGAYKADLIRYCFLYFFGGCYFDCKQILRKPISTFVKDKDDFLICNDVIENAYLNAVLLCRSKHPIMKKVIDDCVVNIKNKITKSPLEITGPVFLYKSIHRNMTQKNIVFQNCRPPNDFNDFTKDYFHNNIKLIKTWEVVINRFYPNYYNDYLETNHYGKLFYSKEIFYTPVRNNVNVRNNTDINDQYLIYIYPHPYQDKFEVNYQSPVLTIKKEGSIGDGWNFPLKIRIIDEKLFKEATIEVGISNLSEKKVLYLFDDSTA